MLAGRLPGGRGGGLGSKAEAVAAALYAFSPPTAEGRDAALASTAAAGAARNRGWGRGPPADDVPQGAKKTRARWAET